MAEESEMHLTSSREVSALYDRITLVKTWQGPWDEIEKRLSSWKIGDVEDCEDMPWPENWNEHRKVKLMDARASRQQAGRGVLTATFVAIRPLVVWGLDFSEVTKDIHTWMADAEKSDARPDLGIISQWEALKDDTAHIKEYTSFKYFSTDDDGQSAAIDIPDGNTKKLAEMIIKGIDSYSIFIPIITCQATAADIETVTGGWCEIGALLGAEYKPEDDDWFDNVGGVTASSLISTVGKYYKSDTETVERRWWMTADRLTVNGDGTLVRNMQWAGVDDINEYLYPVEKD